MSSVKMSLKEKLEFIHEIKDNYFYYLAKLIAKYGEIFTVSLPFINIHFINSPQHVKYVFDCAHDYTRASGLPVAKEILGDYALIISNDPEIWKMDRQTLMTFFHEKYLREYSNIMVEVINRHLNSWQDYVLEQKPLMINDAITDIAFDILLKTLYGGIDIDIPYAAHLIHEASRLNQLGGSKYLGVFPTRYYFAVKEVKKKLIAIGDSMVEQCLASKNKNIISLLAETYQNKEDEITLRKHLRGEALGFAFAGQETSSATLVRALVYISQHPQVAEKLYAEVRSILGNKLPTYDDVAQLTYIQAVVMETLRIEPPLRGLGRKAIRDTQVGKLKIKKGDIVGISIYHLHRLPQYWENPECFNPERFIHPLDDHQKSAFIPFGLGPHACLGRQFAIHESVLVLAMIAQRFELWLTSFTKVERLPNSIGNRLNSDLTMTVHNLKTNISIKQIDEKHDDH